MVKLSYCLLVVIYAFVLFMGTGGGAAPHSLALLQRTCAD